MTERACTKCRRIVAGEACPVCGDSKLTKEWEGYILLMNVDGSEIAKEIGASTPGKYALKIK